MKKVLFNKWIPKQTIQREGSAFQGIVPGTGCYEKGFHNRGRFISWGLDSDDNGGSFTVALVLQNDGTVEKILVENIKFVKREEKNVRFNSNVAFKVKEGGVTLTASFEDHATDEEIVEYFEENYGTVYNWWRI